MGDTIKKIWQESTVLGECNLIFVTVGGMRAFERLIKEMDRVAGELDEKVVMQIGSTDYEPKNCDYFKFMPRKDIEKLYDDARVVVSHAGGGSILTALEYNKPLVLVPRLRKYGEVFDDHQLEIAREMEARGAAVVYDISKLESIIRNVNTSLPKLSAGRNLVGALKEYLDQLKRQLGRL
jgi:beta-1,4-N-acetylglucosaminyltransferase